MTTVRRDHRRTGLVVVLLAVAAGGWALQTRDSASSVVAPPEAHAAQARTAEVNRRFDEAVVMLHARQYDHAVTALHRLMALAPEIPEAHANMGFALLGLGRVQEARAFFEGAIALKADQGNAYYGLALAHEAGGDLALATGAMRSYLHLARDQSPEHLRRARAALWEWEQARPAATR